MKQHAYAEIAAGLGLTYCRGINPRNGSTCYEDHISGAWADGMIHWAERQVVKKAGIRRFLMIASMSNPVVANSTPGWQQLYVQNRWVSAMARAKLIRLPARLANLDRARVRAAIVNLPVETPLREEALRWSQQR